MNKSYKQLPARTVAGLALVALVVGVLAGWFAAAGPAQAEANTVRIDPASATVPPGGSVDLAVIADAPALGFGSWDLDITYDQAVVNVTACVPHPSGGCAFATAGRVDVIGFVGTALTGEQTLATISFSAIGTEGQSSAVAITVVDFNDGNGDPTSPATTGGTIQAPPAPAGPGLSTATPGLSAPAEPPTALPSTGTSGPAQRQTLWLLIGVLTAAGTWLASAGLAASRRAGREAAFNGGRQARPRADPLDSGSTYAFAAPVGSCPAVVRTYQLPRET